MTLTPDLRTLNERYAQMMRELFPIPESDGSTEGRAAVPPEIPPQRSGASRDPLGDGSVKVGPHREDAAGIKPCPSDLCEITPECRAMFERSYALLPSNDRIAEVVQPQPERT